MPVSTVRSHRCIHRSRGQALHFFSSGRLHARSKSGWWLQVPFRPNGQLQVTRIAEWSFNRYFRKSGPAVLGWIAIQVSHTGRSSGVEQGERWGGEHPDCLRPNLAIRWRVVVRGKMKEGVGNEILTAHIHRHKRETVDKCEGHLEIQSFVLAGVGLSTLV